MQLPNPTPGSSGQPFVETKGMILANDLAGQFFQHCFKYTEAAQAYVAGRKLPDSALQKFLIGFAPNEWQGLKEAIPGYATESACVDCGLVIESEKGGRRYDRFRNRIMFGIRDARGRVVGFGGRSLDGSTPKYLNSPASALFDKSNTLFGIFEARESIRRTGQVLVTEGYMDTVALSVHGIPQTVATMGTACTEQHLERLTSLADEVIFAFDGDGAGLKAAWKTLNLCLPHAADNKTFKFMLLPSGQDPDETILAEGLTAFQTRIDSALSLSSFMIKQLAEDNDNLKTAENRAKFLMQGTEMIKRLPFGGNLYKVLRDELQRASQTPKDQVLESLTRTTIPAQQRASNSGWSQLASAASSQKKTASSIAESLLTHLDESQHDAFFNRDFSQIPQEQRQFWENLFNALIDPDPQDSDTEIGPLQRDLLKNANVIVKAEVEKAKRAKLKDDFRAGTITEQQLFSRQQG